MFLGEITEISLLQDQRNKALNDYKNFRQLWAITRSENDLKKRENALIEVRRLGNLIRIAKITPSIKVVKPVINNIIKSPVKMPQLVISKIDKTRGDYIPIKEKPFVLPNYTKDLHEIEAHAIPENNIDIIQDKKKISAPVIMGLLGLATLLL